MTKLVLYGIVGEDARKKPMEFFRAGYLLVVISAVLLLFPRFRHPRFYVLGVLLVVVPFALLLFFRPRCVLTDEHITIRRGRRAIRTFPMERLTAIGRYQEGGAVPQLFLCTVSRKELHRFARAHERDCEIISKNYGYAEPKTEAETWRVVLTVYLWRKGSIYNQNIYKIGLKSTSWEKLEHFCREKQLEPQNIIVPQ